MIKRFFLWVSFILIGSCFLFSGDFLIFGHGGGGVMYVPENTIASCKRGLELGANAIEVDVSITRDKVVVLWHDWSPNGLISLARQASLQGLKYRPWTPNIGSKWRKKVTELTYNELKKHYGYVKASKLAIFIGVKKDLRFEIPDFKDFVIFLAKNKGKVRKVFLDIKIPPEDKNWIPDMIDVISQYATQYDLFSMLIFFSPYPEIIETARDYMESSTYRKKFSRKLDLGLDQELPARPVLIVKDEDKRYEVVKKAHQLGCKYAAVGRPTKLTVIGGWKAFKKVVSHNLQLKKQYPEVFFICWTLDKRDEILWTIKAGVDGVISNIPERVKEVFDYIERTNKIYQFFNLKGQQAR